MRRAIAALAAAAIGALTVGAAHATAQPSGRAPAGELTLVSQDTVSTTPGNTVTFTVAVPANVDLAALAPDAQVIVTGHEAIERSEPGGELLDTRGRLAAAIAGRLPPVTQETGIPVVNLAQPAAGQLAIPVVVDGDGTSGTPLALGGPGIHPVRLRLESAGQDIGDVLTFVQVTDPATIHAPLAVAVAVGTDADVHLDDQLQVVLDDATVAELTKLADVLEASATPITVHVEPALLAALRASQPALADRFAAVLKKATVMSAPNLPLDVSAAAAADQRPLYTQWLAAGEDLFGTTDLPGTTLRAATAVTTPLSEPGGELLRDLGTRLLLLPPDIYDSLGGSILGYTDTSQLVRVRLSDDRSSDAAIVDRAIGRRLANPSDQPYLDAVYTTVDLLADRQDFITRQLDPARRTVLIGTSDLGLPDPAVLGPLTQLITSTAGLSVSSVSQLGASDRHDGLRRRPTDRGPAGDDRREHRRAHRSARRSGRPSRSDAHDAHGRQPVAVVLAVTARRAAVLGRQRGPGRGDPAADDGRLRRRARLGGATARPRLHDDRPHRHAAAQAAQHRRLPGERPCPTRRGVEQADVPARERLPVGTQ